MDPSPPARPALRRLDVHHIDDNGVRGVVLSDPLGLLDGQVYVPEGLLPVVGRFDGIRSHADITAELRTAFQGEDIPDDFVPRIVAELDSRLLLLSPRFEQALAAAADDFGRRPVRPPAHAGSAGYPAEPARLRAALDAMVRRPGQPWRAAPRGLVAPHIDLARGREGYALAYSYLAECAPADLYVVFGTGHQGPRAMVTGLRADWQTPLGTARTDRAFVDAVHRRLGAPAPSDLFLHRHEHSIEFQMLFLTHVLRDADFAVAGFLTGSLAAAGGELAAPVAQVVDAFRAAAEASGKRVCFVAGADLAHQGPYFGDAEAVDERRLTRLAAVERARLAHLERGDAAAFHAAVEAAGNPDRVCGAAPIYLAAALAGGGAELLHYEQALAPDRSQVVSFCSLAFPGAS